MVSVSTAQQESETFVHLGKCSKAFFQFEIKPQLRRRSVSIEWKIFSINFIKLLFQLNPEMLSFHAAEKLQFGEPLKSACFYVIICWVSDVVI